DFASGRSAFDRALALAEQMGNPARLAFTLALRSWIAVLAGDWKNARADLDRAASVSSQTDHSWYSVYLPIFLARLFLMEGASDPAATQARDALTISEQSGDLQARRLASGVLAELDILEGRPEAARARLLPLLDRSGLEECDVTLLLPVLAWAHLELDQVDLAVDAVDQTFRRARPEEMRLALVEALRVRVMIALRRERWDEAALSLEEGIALARSMPYPYAEARLLELERLLHAQTGNGG
ncbi:MAG: tetratricopeptide repeat protein, partial [Chloroflexota bacterium]